MAGKLKAVAEDQLIETSKVSFAGINAEYTGMEDISLGQPVKFTITGYVRKEGTELLEAAEEDGEPTTRPFIQVKITGLKRQKVG